MRAASQPTSKLRTPQDSRVGISRERRLHPVLVDGTLLIALTTGSETICNKFPR
jgi:hypothetical protein